MAPINPALEVRGLALRQFETGLRAAVEAVRFFALPLYDSAFTRRPPPELHRAVARVERYARGTVQRLEESSVPPLVAGLPHAPYWANTAVRSLCAAPNRSYPPGALTDVIVYVCDAMRASGVSDAGRLVYQHLVDTDWLIKYDWTPIYNRGSIVQVPQFPYTRGPLRIWWPRGKYETCWTLSELQHHRNRKSRHISEMLVAIDAASEGVLAFPAGLAATRR